MKFTYPSMFSKSYPFGLSLALCLLCLISGPLKGQQLRPFFRSIGAENGLSHAKVNCILQDSRGFMWFGTEDGLNRYDGRFFTVYKNVPNDGSCISGNIITDLYEDKMGVLWIATADGGLTRYNYHLSSSEQFRPYRYRERAINGIPENHINKIAEDGHGNLWLATANSNVVRFNKKTEKFDIPIRKGPKGILTLVMAADDTLWVGRAGGGLLKINTRTLGYKTDPRYSNLYSKMPHSSITAIFKSRDNNMWFGSWDKILYSIDQRKGAEKAFRPSNGYPGAPNSEVLSFAEDNHRGLWMAGHSGGLTLYDRSAGRFTNFTHDGNSGSLVDNNVNTVFVDKSGILWIGTDNGISIYDPVYTPFEQHFLPKSKDGKDIVIYDFYQDEKQNLWIATSEGIFIKNATSPKLEYRKIVYKGNILAATKFFVDSDGTSYLGTDYTLFKYDVELNSVSMLPNTDKDQVMNKLINSRIVSVVRDTIGSHPVLMVSPYGHYLTYYDLMDKKWVSRSDSVRKIIKALNIRDNLIKKIFKDRTGGMWLATQQFGLGDWRKLNRPIQYFINDTDNNSSISSNDVFDIQEDNSNNLWISTYGGGLNYFDKKAHRFSHIKGSSSLTEGIQSDHAGNVWMICNGHMHFYSPLAKIYSCYDLPSLKNNGGVRGYLYKDNLGKIYAGGVNFYISFSPEYVRKIKNEPDIYFTDFRIFNKSYSQLLEKGVISLNHAENYFSFEFSAPEYNSNHVYYEYMLEGIDEDWVSAKNQNSASYSNLPGGKYLFKVRASNWNGSLVRKFNSIVIEISPPFWLQYWFYISLGVIIATVGYLIFRYRIKEVVKRQLIRNGIAQDLHDHIGSTLSSISIYSKVAKIYQLQHKDEKLQEVLNTIGETANETIMDMSDIVWTINPKNDSMQNIVLKIQSYAQPLCVAQNINFTINSDNRASRLMLEMGIRKNFFLILKESLNNAIKHSACKNLTVDIKFRKSILWLLISDDGIGFDPSSKSVVDSGTGGGNGLVNIRSRASELGANLKITSEKGKGSCINLLLRIQ